MNFVILFDVSQLL